MASVKLKLKQVGIYFKKVIGLSRELLQLKTFYLKQKQKLKLTNFVYIHTSLSVKQLDL